MADCPHDILYAGLCAKCGKKVGTKAGETGHSSSGSAKGCGGKGQKRKVMVVDGKQIHMSAEITKKQTRQYIQRLREQRKLALVCIKSNGISNC